MIWLLHLRRSKVCPPIWAIALDTHLLNSTSHHVHKPVSSDLLLPHLVQSLEHAVKPTFPDNWPVGLEFAVPHQFRRILPPFLGPCELLREIGTVDRAQRESLAEACVAGYVLERDIVARCLSRGLIDDSAPARKRKALFCTCPSLVETCCVVC